MGKIMSLVLFTNTKKQKMHRNGPKVFLRGWETKLTTKSDSNLQFSAFRLYEPNYQSIVLKLWCDDFVSFIALLELAKDITCFYLFKTHVST